MRRRFLNSTNKNEINTYIIAKYDVITTSEPTQLLGSAFTISQISKMYIDDVEVTQTSEYTFSTLGENEVKFTFDYLKLTSCKEMFYQCSRLTSLDLNNFDTSNVTDMSYMFCMCEYLYPLDVSNFDTSNVTDMSAMFESCGFLTQLTSLDVSNFDTSKVTNMSYMFQDCGSLYSLKMLGNISKVTSFSNMFYGLPTDGTLTYNCAYEDAWANILVTRQSKSKFPSTWSKTCV